MSARAKQKTRGPKIAVIITAFNYDDLIEAAIRSVLCQTHQNFEIVIVDDHSKPASSAKTVKIVKSIGDDRITLIRNETNVGQTQSFYVGLDHTTAEFVCLLDPDDRYLPDFLATMLAAHLNPVHIAPLAYSNQQLMRGDHTQLTGTQSEFLLKRIKADKFHELEENLERFGFSAFAPATTRGWIWTSTSSMMFRRNALEMIRPTKTLSFKGHADTYLANGTHLLGGSLFVHKVLLSRTLHGKNDFSHARIFASDQSWGTPGLKASIPELDAVEALFESGNDKLLRRSSMERALIARLKPKELLWLWRHSAKFRARVRKRIFLISVFSRLRRR